MRKQILKVLIGAFILMVWGPGVYESVAQRSLAMDGKNFSKPTPKWGPEVELGIKQELKDLKSGRFDKKIAQDKKDGWTISGDPEKYKKERIDLYQKAVDGDLKARQTILSEKTPFGPKSPNTLSGGIDFTSKRTPVKPVPKKETNKMIENMMYGKPQTSGSQPPKDPVSFTKDGKVKPSDKQKLKTALEKEGEDIAKRDQASRKVDDHSMKDEQRRKATEVAPSAKPGPNAGGGSWWQKERRGELEPEQ